ncbi:MAG TPA: hypothetical protein VHE53_05350 [Patescibacteria group bacterium]|nr:hypothetical protein [Patescibacteria group bacterium]
MKKALLLALFGIAMVFSTSIAIAPKAQAASILDFVRFPEGAKVRFDGKINFDTNNLTLIFTNPIFAKKISYELTYKHNGIEEGVMGSINNNGNIWPIKKVIYLGTCSTNGACVPHTGLSDVKIKITVNYTLFDRTEVYYHTILP